MNEVDLMVALYKEHQASMSEKQKAEAERRIWEAHCAKTIGDRGDRRAWLSHVLGESDSVHEHRLMLAYAGNWVLPLWDLIDGGVSRHAVARLYRQAKSLAAKGELTPEQALESVLDEYRKAGLPPRSSSEKLREPEPDQPVPSIDFASLNTPGARTRTFFAQLASLADAYLKSSVEGLSDEDGALAIRMAGDEFTGLVREAAHDLQRRVNSVRSSVRKESRRQKVSREQFRQACEVLNLSFTYGQPVDLRLCKKMMLKRAAPLHPDRNNGSNERNAEYRAIIESFAVLERYSEGLKPNEN